MQAMTTAGVHRAGTAHGLPGIGLPRALRIGVLLGWTTVVASLQDPVHRPIGMVWALLTLVAGGFGWILAGSLGGAAAGAAVGFVGYLVIIMLMSVIIEPALFTRADMVWLIDEPGRHGCAKASVVDGGAWRLTSVAAWPFGRGIGTQLTQAIAVDADHSGHVVQLTAENRRVGALYERFGFTYPAPGRRGMRRTPAGGDR